MTTGDNSPVPDFLSRLRVDGRTFVVAGAGVGMGRMTSHALVQAGAKTVVCVDVDNHGPQQSLRKECIDRLDG